MPDITFLSLFECRQTILPAQGQSLPEGKEAACVLGEEMLILALILKGPGRSIALSSLRKREINVFKGEAGCMWCMRVGFIDTARRCS